MILERLISQLKHDEGFRELPYQDTVGVWTIGYGTTHVEDKKVNENWLIINKNIGEDWLFINLAGAIRTAKRFVNNFNKLSHEKQESLVNMCYQMGNRVFTFKKAQDAIQRGLWDKAYRELLNSKWAKQTPKRAKRVAEKFLS